MSATEDPLQDENDPSATVLLPSDKVDRSDAVPMLTCDGTEDEETANGKSEFLKITRKYVPTVKLQKPTCGTVRRFLLLIVGCVLVGLSLILMVTGTIRFHQCQRHQASSVWDNRFLGAHFDDLVSLNNFALEKPSRQSSTNQHGDNGVAALAVDGNRNTCSETDEEITASWQVDIGQIRAIGDIMIHGQDGHDFSELGIYVSITNSTADREECFRHRGTLSSHLLVTNCGENLSGRYITVEMSSNKRVPIHKLVLCEVIITQR